MKPLIRTITLGALGTASWLLLGAVNLCAQDGPPQGNLDAAQMRQRMLDHMRQRLEVPNDAEWKIVSDRINKVTEVRQVLGGPGGPPPQTGDRGPGGFGPPGGDPQSGPGGPQGNADKAGRSRGGPGGPGGLGGPGGFSRQSSPELDALNKALDGKASADEIKNKLAAWRAAQKKKEAALAQAEENLRKLLSVRQEAVAVTLGLLN